MNRKLIERLEIEQYFQRIKQLPMRIINLIRAGKEGSRQWLLLEKQHPQIFAKTLKEYASGDWD